MALEPYVLAVDPGRDKTGIAILTRTSQLMMMDIVPTDSVMCELQSLLRMYAGVSVLVCGNGTNHKAVGTIVKHVAESQGKLFNFNKNTTRKKEERKRKNRKREKRKTE